MFEPCTFIKYALSSRGEGKNIDGCCVSHLLRRCLVKQTGSVWNKLGKMKVFAGVKYKSEEPSVLCCYFTWRRLPVTNGFQVAPVRRRKWTFSRFEGSLAEATSREAPPPALYAKLSGNKSWILDENPTFQVGRSGKRNWNLEGFDGA